MDNSELSYEDGLVRLYEARAQLELDVAVEAATGALRPIDGLTLCQDCSVAPAVLRYRRVDLCPDCALSRIRVARRIALDGD